jgi:protoporphyrinogen oxidase
VNKKVLVLGGGVAGSSMAYYLSERGYDVTVVEKNSRVGGLARTCYYAGHPYEFGPHIWFWPGGEEEPINHTIVKLTNNELFHMTSIRCRSARPFTAS